jgi:hypothetical protein
MASRIGWIVGIVRPCLNPKGGRMILQIENLHDPIPHRFTLKNFLYRDTGNVLGFHAMAVQPCPTRTPSRMIVSRCTPVIRSMDRILEPSHSDPMIAICLSALSTFAMSLL